MISVCDTPTRGRLIAVMIAVGVFEVFVPLARLMTRSLTRSVDGVAIDLSFVRHRMRSLSRIYDVLTHRVAWDIHDVQMVNVFPHFGRVQQRPGALTCVTLNYACQNISRKLI